MAKKIIDFSYGGDQVASGAPRNNNVPKACKVGFVNDIGTHDADMSLSKQTNNNVSLN